MIKSVEEKDRCKWPDLLSHLVFVYNTTPHTVTKVTPFTLLFGREPTLPLDHLLSNANQNWDDNFVGKQAALLQRADDLVKQRIESHATANEKQDNGKRTCSPISIGSHVLLKKCAFTGRHKLDNYFEADPYKVVNVNVHKDVYTIQPCAGGPEKVVNRKYLHVYPQECCPDQNQIANSSGNPPDSGDRDSSQDEEEFVLQFRPGQNRQDLPVSTLRRSRRPNIGVHSNPFHLPRSVNHP